MERYYNIKDFNVPEWQKSIVKERLSDYYKNSNIALDFDSAMDELEKEVLLNPSDR